MQNKGFVKVFAVLLALVCIFYLSFSFVTSHFESKAEEIAAVEGEDAAQHYLDSLANEPVYFGVWTLKECREMGIGLGVFGISSVYPIPWASKTTRGRSQAPSPPRTGLPASGGTGHFVSLYTKDPTI